ncbi:hypothetical protein [Allokutzneria sp. NRRL B-24872]|uniref:hypothetical protein n=1 Tax=Allokutzneria sp. NRRL B-24872 TaxID=1137961 RepID=UPI000A3B58D2|nr:hypothetical protein [Allokutzneria sp. NRRL B-24872]
MTSPRIRATDASRTVDDPTDEQLHDLLADMSLRANFVVVERLPSDAQHYVQVALDGEPGFGSYQVEYREGGPSAHFQALVLRDSEWGSVYDRGFEQVVRVVQDWVADRPGWRTALPWTPLDLDS